MRFVGIVALMGNFVAAGGSFGVELDCSTGNCDIRQLVATCKRLESNEQIKAFKTNVYCAGSKTYWEQTAETADLQLPRTFHIHNRVSMKGDRYKLGTAHYQIMGQEVVGQCRKYVQKSVNIPEFPIVLRTCAELEEVANMGRGEYCRRYIEEKAIINFDEGTPTGETHSRCQEAALSPEHGARFQSAKIAQENRGGIEIISLPNPEGILGALKLRAGDIIVSVNDQPISTVANLEETLSKLTAAGTNLVIIAYRPEDRKYYRFE